MTYRQADKSDSVGERLTRYIDSDKIWMPGDYKDYTPGGFQAEHCVFCRGTLEDMQNLVFKRNPVTQQLATTFTCCCDSCDEKISQHFGDRPEGSGQLDGKTLRRIEEFIKFGLVEEDHIHYRQDFKADNLKYTFCYFCQKQTYEVKARVLAPITENKLRTGGYINCCPTCSAVMSSKSSWGQIYDIIYTRCDYCNATYSMSPKEDNYRAQLPATVHYNCNKCAEKTAKIHQNNPKSLFYGEYRTDYNSRYTDNLGCASCGKVLLYDLYMDFRQLAERVPDATKVYCVDCAKSKSKGLDNLAKELFEDISETLISINLEKYQIIVKKDLTTGLWGYEIVRPSGITISDTGPIYRLSADAVKKALDVVDSDENSEENDVEYKIKRVH